MPSGCWPSTATGRCCGGTTEHGVRQGAGWRDTRAPVGGLGVEEVLSLWAMGLITGGVVWGLRSLTRHWERKHQRLLAGTESQVSLERRTELERLAAGNAALEGRVVELEERLDFAERLLTRGRPGAALHGGSEDGG